MHDMHLIQKLLTQPEKQSQLNEVGTGLLEVTQKGSCLNAHDYFYIVYCVMCMYMHRLEDFTYEECITWMILTHEFLENWSQKFAISPPFRTGV